MNDETGRLAGSADRVCSLALTELRIDESDESLEWLRNLLARVVSARESVAYGDVPEAALILADLEHDMASLVEDAKDVGPP